MYSWIDNFKLKLNSCQALLRSKFCLLRKKLVFGYYSGTNIEPNRGLLIDSSNIQITTLKFGFYNLQESVFVYELWYSSNFEPGWYWCFDWTQFLVADIELRLNLGYRLLRFTSRTNLESVPRFAEIWNLKKGVGFQIPTVLDFNLSAVQMVPLFEWPVFGSQLCLSPWLSLFQL